MSSRHPASEPAPSTLMSARRGRSLWQRESHEDTSCVPSQRCTAEHKAPHQRLLAPGLSSLPLHPHDANTNQRAAARRMPHSYLSGECETLVIFRSCRRRSTRRGLWMDMKTKIPMEGDAIRKYPTRPLGPTQREVCGVRAAERRGCALGHPVDESPNPGWHELAPRVHDRDRAL